MVFLLNDCVGTEIDEPLLFLAFTTASAEPVERFVTARSSRNVGKTLLCMARVYVFLRMAFSDNSPRNVGKNLRECQM
jgi:hypothetical protein